MHDEPIMDVAHLGHLELLTPKPDESLRFFVDVMGMTESGRQGDSVYLRAWDDYERYSLQADRVAHVGPRPCRLPGPQPAGAAAAGRRRLKGSGHEIGWHEDELGHGPAFRFRDPDGHLIELYYETEWYEAPPELRPALKNQAQRYPGARRQRAPARPLQLPRRRCAGQPRVLRDAIWASARPSASC